MATLESAMQLQSAMMPALGNVLRLMNMVTGGFEKMEAASSRSINISAIHAAQKSYAGMYTEVSALQISMQQTQAEQEASAKAVEKSVEKTGAAAGKLKAYLSKAFEAVGGMDSVKKVLELSDKMTQSNARLGMIVEDGGSVEELQQKIFAMSQRSRTELAATGDTVVKLVQSGGDIWNSNDEAIQFAENMNKHFIVAGASQESMAAASAQLTEAMGAGNLGEGALTSLLDTAPNMIQTIADYMGLPIAQIRSMAAEGQISAEVVKNAMLGSTEAIDAQLNNVPMTWGQVWTSFQSQALMAFQPVLEQVSMLVNSEQVQAFIQNITMALQQLAGYIMQAFGWIAQLGNSIAQNWETVGPIIYGVIASFIAYKAITTIVGVAQALLNTIMGANPIAIIAIAIGVLIALFAKWAQSVGGISIAWMMMQDFVLTKMDALRIMLFIAVSWIQDKWGQLSVTFQRVGVFIANFVGDMKANVLMLLQSMVNGAIDIINKFIGVLNNNFGLSFEAVAHVTFGTNAALKNEAEKQAREAALQNSENQLQADMAKRQAVLEGMKEEAIKQHWVRQIEIYTKQAMQDAEALAAEEEAKRTAAQQQDPYQYAPNQGAVAPASPSGGGLGEVAGNTGATAENTARMADSMDGSTEELKWLRVIAERLAIDKATKVEVNVDMSNMQNSMTNSTDIDGFLNGLTERVEEAVLVGAQGAHQ